MQIKVTIISNDIHGLTELETRELTLYRLRSILDSEDLKTISCEVGDFILHEQTFRIEVVKD